MTTLRHVLKGSDDISSSREEDELCSVCTNLRVSELCKNRLPADESINASYGTVAEVVLRKTCPFCRLITQLLPFERQPTAKIGLKVHLGVFNIYQEGRWRGHIYKTMPTPGVSESYVNELSAEMIRGWIADCESKHAGTDKWSTQRYQETVDIILIDVLENRLVRKSSDCRYLTLSYVWGGRAMHQMTSAEWPSLQHAGSLQTDTSHIPRLFRDMMELTRMLSERYCWIDALCIPQDNPKEKKRQISQMDIIYRQALTTVIVLSADNSQACMPGVQPGTRLPVDAIETIEGMQLLARRPSFMHTMNTSAHWTRGWTYQEQLLSKRCLHLSNHEAMFYCHGTVQGDAPGSANSLDLQRHVKSLNKLSILFDEDVAQLELRPDSWFKALPLFSELTSEFSSRRLSDPADALDAFSGILAVMKYRLGGRILSGLPVSILDEALLWIPAAGSDIVRNLRFPSWTWAGWTGTISYSQGPLFPTPLNSTIAVAVKPEISLIDRGKDISSPLESPSEPSPHFDPTSQYRLGNQFQDIRKFPLDGAVLQFWAYAIDVDQFPPHSLAVSEGSEDSEASYRNVKLFGKNNTHCGTLFNIRSTLELQSPSPEENKREYICLSRSQYPQSVPEFRQRRVKRNILREPWLSQYLASLFDHDFYQPRPWCLVNVMLVEWKGVYAERIALCQIHEDAWQEANPQWKLFTLG